MSNQPKKFLELTAEEKNELKKSCERRASKDNRELLSDVRCVWIGSNSKSQDKDLDLKK